MTLSAQLSLVQLEDRTCLDTLHWRPGANLLWSTVGNWELSDGMGGWGKALAAPGPNDIAVFERVGAAQFSPGDCIVDSTTTVKGVQVVLGYAHRLHLRSPLTIAHPTDSPTLSLSSGTATIGGDATFGFRPKGSLHIGGANSKPATMEFYNGNLVDLDVFVTADSTLHVEDGSNTTRNMTDTSLNVDGRLHWEDGNVTIGATNGTSNILIGSSGRFEIQAGGFSWKGAGVFRTENRGLVTKPSGGVTQLGGDYLSRGTTHVAAGTLEHLNKAEQLAGIYYLDFGSTVRVQQFAPGLQIHGGGLQGVGTVDGGLNVGLDPNLTPAPTPTGDAFIRPVIAGDNTILVKGSMQLFANNVAPGFGVTTLIEINAGGVYSKIVVLGQRCELAGRLLVFKHEDDKPPPGTVRSIITAPAVSGDFAVVDITNNIWYPDEPPGPAPDPATRPYRYYDPQKQATQYRLLVIHKVPPGDPQ